MLSPLVRTIARVLAAGESGSPCWDGEQTHKISAHLHIPFTTGLGIMKWLLSPWLPRFLGQLSLGGDHQVAPVDWAEPPVLSSYPQTPSCAAECWPKMSRRNLTWPSPAAAEGKPKPPTVKTLVFLSQQSCGAFNTEAANLAHELIRC